MMRLTRKDGRLQLPGGPVRPHDARPDIRLDGDAARGGAVRGRDILEHSLGKVSDTCLVDDSFERRRAAHVLVAEYWSAVRTGVRASLVRLRVKERSRGP